MKEDIEEFLRAKDAYSPETAVPTLEIAREVVGKGASRKSVNSVLYGMQKQKLIDKVSEDNGAKPKWYLLHD